MLEYTFISKTGLEKNANEPVMPAHSSARYE